MPPPTQRVFRGSFPRCACAALAALLPGCCPERERRLDAAQPQELQATMRLRYEPGLAAEAALAEIQAGDVLVFSTDTPSSAGSSLVAQALGGLSHAAIAFRGAGGRTYLLTADSERGVHSRSLAGYAGERGFFVYAFPPGALDLERLDRFAQRAEARGTLDYDWSAALWGLNSELTPDTIDEVDDEYTCATVVAAALHYSGLSLADAHCGCGYVTPSDLIHSPARRNVNAREEP